MASTQCLQALGWYCGSHKCQQMEGFVRSHRCILKYVIHFFVSHFCLFLAFLIFFNFAKNAAQNEYNQLVSSKLNISFGSYSVVLTIEPSRGYGDGGEVRQYAANSGNIDCQDRINGSIGFCWGHCWVTGRWSANTGWTEHQIYPHRH